MRFAPTLPALALLVLVSRPATADVFWKMADPGPATPDVQTILGDDSRTLAFASSGVFEYRSGAWARTRLSAPDGDAEVPGVPFFAGGAFFALKGTGRFTAESTLYRLSSNAWQRLATFTPSGGEITHDSSFLYAVSGTFDDCVTAPSGACSAAAPARLFTVSLSDGLRRDGPLLPVCSGRLIAAGGTIYLAGVRFGCAGPSARRSLGSTATPMFRLDGGAWTALPPLTDYVESSGFVGTSRGLWVAVPGTNLQSAVRLLSASGLSAPILVPQGIQPFAGASPVEWGGEILYTSSEPSGNVFHLVGGAFVPFNPFPTMQLPYGRHVEIHATGSRLFATGDGYAPQVLQAGIWSETPGIEGTAGADTYLVSRPAVFASRGGTFWRRDASGWTRLPTPPIGTQRYRGVVWQERPVLVDQITPGRLLAYSVVTGSWESVVGSVSVDSLLVSGNALCTANTKQVGCLRDGSWTFAPVPQPPPFASSPSVVLRDLDGSVAVLGANRTAFRFAGDTLEPLFADLPPGLFARDVVSAEGRSYLLVGDGRPYSEPHLRAVVVAAEPGYPSVLTDREDLLYSFNGLESALSVSNGRLFISRTYPTFAGSLRDGQFRQARAEAPIGYMDPEGLFASTGSNDLYQRGALLLPVVRVRKTLPAVVDTFGQGGSHFRTTVSMANLSATRPAVAHVTAIATGASFDLELPPMTQRRVDDPFPGLVGPASVDFVGLDDEREAWASARVFSAVGAGTAGTALDATDPGSNAGFQYLLAPAPRSGTRRHVATANSGDGAGLPLRVSANPPMGPGEFRQRDLVESDVSTTIQVYSTTNSAPFPADDGIAYAVRNDDVTNDGTVVAMEPPHTAISRRTRFLPAVVSLTSNAACYRTELRLVRTFLHDSTAGSRTFHVLFRSASASGEFDVHVSELATDIPDAGEWLSANGVSLDPSSLDGTLTFTSDRPEGAADLLVTAAVVATPVASSGDFGVSVPIANEGRWASISAIVPGLLEDGAFRSNLAVANPEPPGGPSTTLTISLHRAADGAMVGFLPAVVLGPGERYQFNHVSKRAGLSGTFDGYAIVRRTSGFGRFVAYGVLNDETTSDGTLLSMTRTE